MDIKATLSNPWVLGGGVVLGVIVLAMSHTSSGDNNGTVSSPGNALLNYQAQQNSAGMDYTYKMAELAAQKHGAMDLVQLQKTLGLMKSVENIASIDATHDVQRLAINGEITKTRIQAQTAASVEANTNFTRLLMSYVGADSSKYAIDANERINGMNNFTQMAIQENAQTQQAASAGLSSVLNFIPKLFGKSGA